MSEEKDEVVTNPDPHFEPIIHLPAVQTKTLEEDEQEMLKLRAKLFRYDSTGEPREWKERGTGEVKILKHNILGTCRVLMRRDKTLKICANHHVLPQLELKPNCGSDRAWVWSTPADFADEEPKQELLAIRFANAENAQKFHEVFEEAKSIMASKLPSDQAQKIKDNGDNAKDVTKTTKKDEQNGVVDGEKGKEKDEEKDKETNSVAAVLDKLSVSDAATNSNCKAEAGSESKTESGSETKKD
jgi:Ran-binding protein 1